MIKSNLNDLAIFGGRPAYETPLHVNQPNIGDKAVFQSILDEVWDSKWYTNNGPTVRSLETKLQEYMGVSHCVLTSSGTSAMAVLVSALELTGEVILPSFTFISTAHVLSGAGIRPVFCDIDPGTHNICLQHCEKLINPSTSAVIPTHTWGNACNIDRLEDLCEQNGVPVLYDAAHAFGSTYQGKAIASLGLAQVFSFHATKVFHTFEGGAITTNSHNLAERLKKIRNFGFGDYDKVELIGTNAKMSEIHAAVGLTNLQSIESTLDHCRTIHDVYRNELAGIRGIDFLARPPNEKTNYQYVVAVVDSERLGMSRDCLMQLLHEENVLARRYFFPGCHVAAPYQDLTSDTELPATMDIASKVLVLPGGASVCVSEAKTVSSIIKFAAANSVEIGHKLGGSWQAVVASDVQ